MKLKLISENRTLKLYSNGTEILTKVISGTNENDVLSIEIESTEGIDIFLQHKPSEILNNIVFYLIDYRFRFDFFEYFSVYRRNGNLLLNVSLKYYDDLFYKHFSSDAIIQSILNSVGLVEGLKIVMDDDDLSSVVIEYNPSGDELISKYINEFQSLLKQLIEFVELNLSGFSWNPIYEKDEKKFTLDVLMPLFRKMKLISPRYNHGVKEFGKDIVFTEIDQFNFVRYHSVQVKAGNINGGVNSQIDEIIGQIDDAFKMPFYEVGYKEEKFISSIYIIISGYFSDNAKNKILYKLSPLIRANVKFIDKDKILELITKYF